MKLKVFSSPSMMVSWKIVKPDEFVVRRRDRSSVLSSWCSAKVHRAWKLLGGVFLSSSRSAVVGMEINFDDFWG
jgi:hypothetical protein